MATGGTQLTTDEVEPTGADTSLSSGQPMTVGGRESTGGIGIEVNIRIKIS